MSRERFAQSISSYAATKRLAASTTIVFSTTAGVQLVMLDHAPILDKDMDAIGQFGGDSSLVVNANFLTTEVRPISQDLQSSDLKYNPGPKNVGEYSVDYVNGVIYAIPKQYGGVAFTYSIRAMVTTAV